MLSVTVQDFLTAFDSDETLELSQLNLVNNDVINEARIQSALDDATVEWLSWFGVTEQDTLPVECVGSGKRCILALARYYLDYLNPRDDVKDRFLTCRAIADDYQTRLRQDAVQGINTADNAVVMSVFSA